MTRLRGKLLLLGPLPPPSGGVSVHVAREAALLSRNGIPVIAKRLGGWFQGKGRCRAAPGASLAMLGAMGTALFGSCSAAHVHHSRWAYTGPVIRLLRVRGIPYAITVHSESLFEELDSAVAVSRRRIVRGLGGAKSVIAVNGSIGERLAGIGVPDGRITVLPAFIAPSPGEADPAVLDPRAREILEETGRSGGTLILTSAFDLGPGHGMDDVYGIELLFRAMEHASVRLPKPVTLAVFTSVDPGPDGGRGAPARLTAKAEESGGFTARFLTGIPMPPFMAAASCYVRPSRTDGDSVAVREALATGIPVAASDVVERPDGTLLFGLDEESLSEALVKACSLPRGTTGPAADGYSAVETSLVTLMRELLPGESR